MSRTHSEFIEQCDRKNWKRISNVTLIDRSHSVFFDSKLVSKASSRYDYPLGMPIIQPYHIHIESHFINQQTYTIRKTSSNKLMLHAFFPVHFFLTELLSLSVVIFFTLIFQESFGLSSAKPSTKRKENEISLHQL